MSDGQSYGWKEAKVYPINKSLKQQLNQYSEKGQEVQIYISQDCTPIGDISFVGVDYIILEQNKMVNKTIIIPFHQIKYLREI